MLATLAHSNPMPLLSDSHLGKQLQRYKHPLGGLDTNKLSQSTSASSPHKALLTMLQNNSEDFCEHLPCDLPIPLSDEEARDHAPSLLSLLELGVQGWPIVVIEG
jgi:hypothetical protein